ncbi:NAD(P)-dependent oxidoreductase [Marinomonas sp. PE14-40]|uniref:NAD(P)-dependent oxidoreductase n=1 Tax=Marinomonas sp. PE14-40 TaxID=3060621 RepID=UPI003F67F303
MKILILDPDRYSQEAISIYNKLGQVDCYSESMGGIESIIHCYEILVFRFAVKLDSSLLEKAKKLKYICCNVTGTDHIDEKYAEAMGVKIISLKGEVEFLDGIHATAELTWGLLLSLIRSITGATNSVDFGEWNRDEFFGSELFGKTLGVVGYGRIGKKIAKYGNCFGMRVVYYDVKTILSEGEETHVSLNELLSMSDIISLHIPLNKYTENIFNYDLFEKMKKKPILLNTSRGGIINDAALINALENDIVRGVALDVLNGEVDSDFQTTNPILNYAKNKAHVLITPHIGGVTKESWEKTEVFIAKKVTSHITLKEK